jgi:beta-mannosidase
VVLSFWSEDGHHGAIGANEVTRRIVNLGGTAWRFGRVPGRPLEFRSDDRAQVEEWLPATVPGNVRSDLLHLGRIDDPFFGTNNEASQRVDEYDWWYTSPLDVRLDDGERAFLCFEGIDYISAVWLDETELGRHEGMFSRQVYEITEFAIHSGSQVAVRIWGSSSLPPRHLEWWEKLWSPLARVLDRGNDPFPDRSATLKCQMSFGWDFAPRLRTMGLWDDVTLMITRGIVLSDLFVQAHPEEARARINLAATIDSDARQRAIAEIRMRPRGDISPKNQRWEFPLALQTGRQMTALELVLPETRLWQPWDRGEPGLYDLELRIVCDGEAVDSVRETFGIRTVGLAPNPGTQRGDENWTFLLNGQPEFVRGANWVPLDALPGRVRREDYQATITMAKEAGINLLRVWAGGLREKKAFYDLCDEQGIMVWQEFPLACLLLGHFPRSERFRKLLRQEATAMVRQLRNHPSLALWCGGNEFSYRRNRRIVDTLEEVVAAEDGTRPFRRTSPGRGDTHNWLVWHGKAPISEFQKDNSPFVSEFGLQSAPGLSSLSRFLPRENIFPPDDLWRYHCVQMEKLQRYVNPLFSGSWEEWVTATQRAQAHGLQVAIEHFRRRKYRTSGTMFWQLNDPWPAISWSIIDHYGQPKLAWERLKSLYGPVLVSLEFPLRKYATGDLFRARVWVVNDLLTPFRDCLLEVLLNGRHLSSVTVSLPPDSCQQVGWVESALGEDAQELLMVLWHGGRILSSNEYDLSYYDPSHARLRDVLYHRIVQWLRE